MVFVNKSLENLIDEARQELMEEKENSADGENIYMDMNVAGKGVKKTVGGGKAQHPDYLEMEKVQNLMNLRQT